MHSGKSRARVIRPAVCLVELSSFRSCFWHKVVVTVTIGTDQSRQSKASTMALLHQPFERYRVMNNSLPATMRAIEAAGLGFDKLRLVEQLVPEPERGEILVKLTAATLNYRDLAILKGTYTSDLKVPFIPASDACPPSDPTTLGEGVKHCTSRYLNNRLEQDHRGIKGRYQPMRGFKCPRSAGRFCRGYDVLCNLLRSRSCPHQPVSANHRRLHSLRCTATAMAILEVA
jgi:hypothetical protein